MVNYTFFVCVLCLNLDKGQWDRQNCPCCAVEIPHTLRPRSPSQRALLLPCVPTAVLWSSSTSHVSRLLVFCVVHMLSHFSYLQLFATLWTVNLQAHLYMGFSRQEYCSELPLPPPGPLPDPGIKPSSLMSPASAGGVFTTSATWEAPAC